MNVMTTGIGLNGCHGRRRRELDRRILRHRPATDRLFLVPVPERVRSLNVLVQVSGWAKIVILCECSNLSWFSMYTWLCCFLHT